MYNIAANLYAANFKSHKNSTDAQEEYRERIFEDLEDKNLVEGVKEIWKDIIIKRQGEVTLIHSYD